ncbi:prepilin-type N-terminal cleavage/methylation domain-containing protein [Candidatus Dojkabacteria bacterium]|uniref:Prepilin-type N-terminal cleavage/methylation domain-containing protein n=1 Tax=Candidatus Dojkabacteria bacterium TaxID=2099670 RepID=A0A955I717_9BACT|nr:prepilin-type N-terminal cleavage/methylation domain-containing protein [Candidatus Dojkabacteria bacterium]
MLREIRILKGFTLMEVILVIAILSILLGTTYLIFNPTEKIEESQQSQALSELREIGRALGFFALDNGYYPADVSRGLPTGLEPYLNAQGNWPDGPLPGSVYDYDNWSGQTCIDSAASGSIQITLREVPGRNPDQSNVWAWYYVLEGKGTPHCTNASEWDKGECINCPGFTL